MLFFKNLFDKTMHCKVSSITYLRFNYSLSAYISKDDKANSLCFIEVSSLMLVPCFNQRIGCLMIEIFRDTPCYVQHTSVF